MANERPSNRPGGYWLASTPSSMPPHAYPDWLLELLGQAGGEPSNMLQNTPSVWPQGGSPDNSPADGYIDSDFAGNALRRPGVPMAGGQNFLNALRMLGRRS